jgi:hypothetical protein
MSVPCKFERSLLSHDEYETIRLTHHPAIYDVEPAELEAMRSRLRKMRDKEQTLSRQKGEKRAEKVKNGEQAFLEQPSGPHNANRFSPRH